MTKSKVRVHINPFEPRPQKQTRGDADPKAIALAIGNTLPAWEGAEIAFSYLFNILTRPRLLSVAIRRAYGSVISANTRKGMIQAAGAAFFHAFPNKSLEDELAEFMNIYSSASSRRNDIAHGVIVSIKPACWYLEANMYSSKRSMDRESPYAYTSAQIMNFGNCFFKLQMDVNAFRDTLREHFDSAPPKVRERY